MKIKIRLEIKFEGNRSQTKNVKQINPLSLSPKLSNIEPRWTPDGSGISNGKTAYWQMDSVELDLGMERAWFFLAMGNIACMYRAWAFQEAWTYSEPLFYLDRALTQDFWWSKLKSQNLCLFQNILTFIP